MKKKLIITGIIVLAVIIGGGIAFYYHYENSHYITTDDAQISADMLAVTPQINGGITDWNAKVGDQVTKGEVLGTQEINTMLNSMAGTTPLSSAAEQAVSDLLTSKASVKSPIEGKIIQTTAIKGQMASTSTSLAVVADMADAYITANIKEANINDIKVGQKVDIRIDAFPGKTFNGKVENIGQAAESIFSLLSSQNSTGNFTKVTQLIPVKISIDGTDNTDLMLGMNTTVKIIIK
jgi:multidrug resistance efflux pump